MSVRKMKCPACGKPAVKADGVDDRGRLGFTPGDKDPCPHCGAKLFVRVTDDYADDCLVTVHVGRDPDAIAKAWNEVHPIGTRVRYWPVRPTSSVLPIETRTTSIGYVNSGGDHASIMVEGVSGSVNLSTHVDALPAVLEPAPVVAAEGRTLLVVECERMPGALDEESYFLDAFFDTVDAEQRLRQLTEDYDEAEGSEGGRPTLTRWVHEADLAAAREDGRREERERADALRSTLQMILNSGGIPRATKGLIEAMIKADDAAKGART